MKRAALPHYANLRDGELVAPPKLSSLERFNRSLFVLLMFFTAFLASGCLVAAISS